MNAVFGIWLADQKTWLLDKDKNLLVFTNIKMANMWFFVSKITKQFPDAEVQEVAPTGLPFGFDPKSKVEVVKPELVRS